MGLGQELPAPGPPPGRYGLGLLPLADRPGPRHRQQHPDRRCVTLQPISAGTSTVPSERPAGRRGDTRPVPSPRPHLTPPCPSGSLAAVHRPALLLSSPSSPLRQLTRANLLLVSPGRLQTGEPSAHTSHQHPSPEGGLGQHRGLPSHCTAGLPGSGPAKTRRPQQQLTFGWGPEAGASVEEGAARSAPAPLWDAAIAGQRC